MTAPTLLAAGSWTLTRALPSDRAKVEALQQAAYARNRILLGVEPLPLLADYGAILETHEVWLAREDEHVLGALILEARTSDLLVWSLATDPAHQTRGLGRAMLAAAEARANELGHRVLRLYTGAPLQHLVDWYTRHGFAIERIEALDDRSIVHMVKSLS